MPSVDAQELRTKVKAVYMHVATKPKSEFHFEMGKKLAEKLGYPAAELDKIPSKAIESFAGVGYHFDLADIKQEESVLDLGSGSGTDSFFAALKVGANGRVIGIDMTDAQLQKAKKLSKAKNVAFKKGCIEKLPFPNNSFDVVISNGVINLCPEKEKVFKEIVRVLRPGGRMAISDIVTENELTQGITCNANLWASCIGGAMQQDGYKRAIEKAGMRLLSVRENPQYQFLSQSAQNASRRFGVKSVSLLAEKVKR